MRGSLLQEPCAIPEDHHQQWYAPTNLANPDTKEDFYSQLECDEENPVERHGHQHRRLQCKGPHQELQHRFNSFVSTALEILF